MSQLQSIQVFADSGADDVVNGARLNSHVNDATLLNGAVIDQVERTVPNAADTLLLGDSTEPDTGTPLKVQVQNLLLQSQRDGSQRWGGTAGGTNTLTVTTAPASTGAYVSGETVRFRMGAAPNSGACTLNVDGRGAVNLYNAGSVALVAGDLLANAVVEATYDGTEFQVVSLAIPTKYLTSYQVAEKLRADTQQYATATGTTTGSTTAYQIAPLDSSGAASFTALYDGMVVRFKANIPNAGATTLSVNGNGTPALVGPSGAALSAAQIVTGQIVEAVYDLANTRFMVVSQLSATWQYISALTNSPAVMSSTNSGATAFAHGLGVVPTRVRVTLVQTNATAQNGYNQNDEVTIESLSDGSYPVYAVTADATNITLTRSPTDTVKLLPKAGSSGTHAAVDVSAGVDTPNFYWKLKVYASL
jgi:hypothetical protein